MGFFSMLRGKCSTFQRKRKRNKVIDGKIILDVHSVKHVSRMERDYRNNNGGK